MSLRKWALLSCILSAIALSACGFKLRGSYNLPAWMHLVYLKSDQPYSEMARVLRRYLKSSSVEVVNAELDNAAVLAVREGGIQRRILSLDERGRAREYEISYRVTFSLSHTAYDKIFPEQHLELMRDYLFDPENALAANAEEVLLVRSMKQEMARLIMARLVAIDLGVE